jgi:GAF domain-containing protein/DNA-binding NarL/FixJ family response regulator
MHHILIVDEEENFLLYLKDTVENFDDLENTVVDLAFTPNQALALTKASIQSGNPYMTFLIDQELGEDMDGIDTMKGLLALCPDSDTVIFTGFDNPEDKIRAYDAGASRYLPKTAESRELILVLKDLARSRREKIENEWRMVFSEMMETALHQSDFKSTAKVIVEHSLKLGFERAHLFWAPKRDELASRDVFVGIECAGDESTPCFSDIKFNLQKMKALRQYMRSHDAVVIKKEDIRGRLEREIKSIGFQFPLAGWWILALWSGTELLGALTLDFWNRCRNLNSHERTLLDFLARQVAVALERANLHDKEKRSSEEAAIISEIGRQVNTGVATKNLTKLLERIREQVNWKFNASNFSIFLYNEQTNTIKFELLYENGVPKKGYSRVAGNGMEEYLLSEKQEINIHNTREFIKQKGINLAGNIPIGWLGTPLQVGEKIIGGMSVQQHNKDNPFSEHDKRFLRAVANQVAGAIQISKAKKEEDEDKERIQLLQHASVEMLRIARKDEDNFWLTVLTIATANFGFGFNRALLFLLKDNQDILCGQTGIGTDDSNEVVREWKRDKKRVYDFDTFLKDMDTGHVHLTPFHYKVAGMEIPLRSIGKESWELLQSGEIVRLKSDEISEQLPSSLIDQFGLSECALLPIMTAKANMGFVIIDNKHNKNTINEKALSSLQSLLSNAGLVAEILRQHEKSMDLFDANLETLGMASHQTLKKTLDRICRTANLISQADWAIIHPFMAGKSTKQIEITNIGHYGNLCSTSTIANLSTDNLRVGGVSKHVLQKGKLIVKDIDKCDPSIRKLHLPEHHFIKSEGVKALVGMAVMDPYNKKDALGILYLDYRKPREFSENDIRHAKSLASLAAVAISNAHEMEEVKQKRQFQLATEIAEAVGASLNLETTMDAILGKLQDSFRETRLCVLLYDKRLQVLKFAPATLKYYKIKNPKYVGLDTFHLDGGTIACRVAKRALLDRKLVWENVGDVNEDVDYLKLDYKVKSEFCISLLSAKNELLGILALEKWQINGFNSQDIELIRTVALHISIAIERAKQKEELEYNSTVAAQTSWAANIAHEINNEVGKILNEAYFIRKMAGENLEIQEHAKSIEESVSHLSVSNPWASKSPELVEIDAILKANLQQFTLLRSIIVDFQSGAPQTKVCIKTVQFQHILKQLVNNAARAMKELDEKKIFVSTQLVNNKTVVEILFQDFGPGISEDKHASAFNRPFTTKETGGYGLLFIRQMVEDIQGDIVLLPYQKGKGAAFLIRIPVADLTISNQSE